MRTVFRAPWKARSKYEHKECVLLGYSSLVHDPIKDRLLFYAEAIGRESEKIGLNETIERALVSECQT